MCVCVCVCVCVFSHVWLFVTLRTIACQSPLFMGFSKQAHWSGLPRPPPGDLPHPGMELVSPALQADSLPLSHQGSLQASSQFVNFPYPAPPTGLDRGMLKWLWNPPFSISSPAFLLSVRGPGLPLNRQIMPPAPELICRFLPFLFLLLSSCGMAWLLLGAPAESM